MTEREIAQMVDEYVKKQSEYCTENDSIPRELYSQYGVKRGLRDDNGNGVVTGLTHISQIKAFEERDGQRVPCDGQLLYRGYDIKDLIAGGKGRCDLFEEGAYLLLFGKLPTQSQLKEFRQMLMRCMALPSNFTKDVIMKAPSADVMNTMTRAILTLSSYDASKDVLTIENVLRQCMELISTFSMLAVYGYHAYNYYVRGDSMYIHRPDPELSIAENFLRMLRPDMKFTPLEAKVLDIAMLLHMEHGGGNNSTFTLRVVTSAASDTYSAVAAAMCSLKGHKHGGANIMVMNMMDDIRAHISDEYDRDEVAAYLDKLLNKEAFDRKGLIYGMGHAVYSLSDPRERVFKGFVRQLAAEKHRDNDMRLYDMIEELAPQRIAMQRKIFKGVSPNVDFYSGFVYDMLGIPRELYTPLFAVARIAGWSAHRIEELVTADKIIRPAYKSLVTEKPYVAMEERK
ncbi:MAG: citrate/2-methylcitrate synthase [Candidatus Fimadaptatus sp.]